MAPRRRPSSRRLGATGRDALAPEVELIMRNHNKVTPCRGPLAASVAALRRADLVDLSLGNLRAGLDGALVREVRREHPNAGFDRRLLARSGSQLLRSPLRPLPMYRW